MARRILPLIGAMIVGAAYWTTVAVFAGVQEPWDASLYWTAAYPGSLLLAGIAGAVIREKAWLTGVLLVVSQGVVLVARGNAGPLWPVGLLFLVVLALPGALAATVGARLARP